ncbi:MAG: hypothetical protein AAB913_03375 [Patescibacteria group bacterium]
MQKICSKCEKMTEYDGDLHCRKIFKDKINDLVLVQEIEKAKLLFDSELFDENWKKSLLNELRWKCEAGKTLNKLIETEIQKIEKGKETKGLFRVANCYNCKESLDNSTRTECHVCHWIVCKCGACGCQYSFL